MEFKQASRPPRARKQNYAQSEELIEEEVPVEVAESKQQIFHPEIDQLLWHDTDKGSYLVKFKERSYLHTEWLTEEQVLAERNGKQKINRFGKVFAKRTIEDDEQYFDQQFLEVDRVLSATEIFPIVHPKKGSEIKGKWSESLSNVMSHLLNFSRDNVHYGVYYLDQLSLIMNRIYLGYYKSSSEFWIELGQFFQNVQLEQLDDMLIVGNTLRQASLILYDLWHKQQTQNFEEHKLGQQYNNNDVYKTEVDEEHKRSIRPEIVKEKRNTLIQQILEEIQTSDPQSVFQKYNLKIQQGSEFEEQIRQQLESQEIDIEVELNNEMKDFVKLQEQQEADIAPWSPGEYTLEWLGEDIGEQTELLTEQDKINLAGEVDHLYLIKWKHLSYLEATWELESVFDCRLKISEFRQFNRSLDKETRTLMIQLNHKHNSLLEHEQGIKKKKLSMNKIEEIKQQLYALNQTKEVHEYTPMTQTIYKDKKLLRDYQLNSLNWLIRSFYEDRNVILADEMGLGKTIQTIALLNHLYTFENYRGPFLVLAPLSTLEHWKRTVEDWTNLNGLLYYDQEGAEGRRLCRHYEWYYTDISLKGVVLQATEMFKFQVLITSYEVYLLDLPLLLQVPFQYIVVDEAHKLKNQNARILQALKRMPCTRTLLLTGTPIQNNTDELFSLLNFIEPQNFPSQKNFMRDYGSLETSEQVDKLNILLRPYILRRQKEDVEQLIPPLQETIIDIEMTTIQKTIYKALYEKNKNMLEQGFSSWAANAAQLNNLEIQLRKCCNHPFLIKEMTQELSKNCIEQSDYIQKLIESSGKMILLDKLLVKFRGEGKKLLIFSQFTMMLLILEEYLKFKGVKYEKIDGQIKARERQNAIDRFNDPTKQREVFLLSTKAGGQGINLTAAEIVVIYDSDWNPQNDVQATARAHRIGQSKEVTVYRLVTKNTYESEMFERSIKKLGLDQAIFMGGQFKQHEQIKKVQDKKFSKQEMEILLKNGIIGLLGASNEGDYQEKNIDEILQYDSRMAKYSLVNGSYTVSKQTFVSEKTDKNLSLQDPNFWKIILKNSESKAQKVFKSFDLLLSLQEQKKYMEEVSECVNQIIESKLNQAHYSADDEVILTELLNKINTSNFAKNYRELAMTWVYELSKPSRRIKRVTDSEVVRKQVRLTEAGGEDARRLAAKSRDELIKKLCYVCERSNCSYYCMGHCRRAFHEECKDLLETSEFVNNEGVDPQFLITHQFPELQYTEEQLKSQINIRYQCPDCRSNLVICLLCKQKGQFGVSKKDEVVLEDELKQLSKCSTANCNRYFHLTCIQSNQFAKLLDSNTVLFRCPSHVCVFCKVNSSNMTTALIHCVRCCRSFHSKCAPYDVKNKMLKIGKKVMICDHCYKAPPEEPTRLDTVIKISLKDYPIKKMKQAKLDFKITGTTERTRRIEQQKLGLLEKQWSRSNSLDRIKKKVQREKRRTDIHPYTYEELAIIPVKEFNYAQFKNVFSGQFQDWCRYCGARFASNFTKGPWGSRTLCTIHYINWGQKKTLDLSEYLALPIEPINRDDPTELQFLQRQKAKDPNFDPRKELEAYNDDSFRITV